MTREDERIEKLDNGESNALDELIELYYPEILRYCLWHAPTRSLAEDATQETFLKVVRYHDRYVHRGKFKAFLYQIAANTCIDMGRKRWLSDISIESSDDETPCQEPEYERVQSDEAFRQLLSGLSEELRELVLLRFGQDLTIRETALVAGLPLRTVQSRLRSALKQLKRGIEEGDTL